MVNQERSSKFSCRPEADSDTGGILTFASKSRTL